MNNPAFMKWVRNVGLLRLGLPNPNPNPNPPLTLTLTLTLTCVVERGGRGSQRQRGSRASGMSAGVAWRWRMIATIERSVPLDM